MRKILRKIGLVSALVGALGGCEGGTPNPKEVCPDGRGGYYGHGSSIRGVSSGYNEETNRADLTIEFGGRAFNGGMVASVEGITNVNGMYLDSLVSVIEDRKRNNGRFGVYGKWDFNFYNPQKLEIHSLIFDDLDNRVQFCFEEQNRR